MATVPSLQTPVLSYPTNQQSDVPGLREKTPILTKGAQSHPLALSVSGGEVSKATRERRHSYRYMGLVTWTTVDTWTEDQGEDLTLMPERRGNITLQLPFSSVQVDFHYKKFMGTPSYALNVTHIIDPCSDLGRQIHTLVSCRDLIELKQLLSRRKLSIYSSYNGASLFYVSVIARIDFHVSFSGYMDRNTDSS